jgi:hypothetical protein
MKDHTHNVLQWLVLIVYGVFLILALWNVWHLSNKVVGKTPEGFHRVDAVELMEMLCLMNKDLRCPDPYQAPNYQRRLIQEE